MFTMLASLIDSLKLDDVRDEALLVEFHATAADGLDAETRLPLSEKFRRIVGDDAQSIRKVVQLLKSANRPLQVKVLKALMNICTDEDYLIIIAEESQILVQTLLCEDPDVCMKCIDLISLVFSKDLESNRGNEESGRLAMEKFVEDESSKSSKASDSDATSDHQYLARRLGINVESLSDYLKSSWAEKSAGRHRDEGFCQPLFEAKMSTHFPGVKHELKPIVGGYLHNKIIQSNAFTVAFWMFSSKYNVICTDGKAGPANIYFCGYSGPGNKLAVFVEPNRLVSLSVPYNSVENKQAAVIRSAVPLRSQQWDFVVASCWVEKIGETMTVHARLFLNGAEVASSPIEGLRGVEGREFSSIFLEKEKKQPWFLGQVDPNYSAKQNAFFRGAFHSVYVFNKAMTPDDLVDISKEPPNIADRLCIENSRTVLSDIVERISNFLKDSQFRAEIEAISSKGSSADGGALSNDRVGTLIFFLRSLLIFAKCDKFGDLLKSGIDEHLPLPLMPVMIDLLHLSSELLERMDNPEEVVPVVVESGHPYEHNLDVFLPLKCETKNAEEFVGMKIWFDPESRCESGCDWVEVRSGDDENAVIGARYTGGKDGGAKNYPTKEAPLIVNSLDVKIYMHSDGYDI